MMSVAGERLCDSEELPLYRHPSPPLDGLYTAVDHLRHLWFRSIQFVSPQLHNSYPISTQPNNVYSPLVYVSPDSVLCVLLSHGLLLELWPSGDVRLSAEGVSSVWLCGSGRRAALQHPALSVFSCDARPHCRLSQGTQVSFRPDGVWLRPAQDTHVWLLDAKDGKTHRMVENRAPRIKNEIEWREEEQEPLTEEQVRVRLDWRRKLVKMALGRISLEQQMDGGRVRIRTPSHTATIKPHTGAVAFTTSGLQVAVENWAQMSVKAKTATLLSTATHIRINTHNNNKDTIFDLWGNLVSN